MTRHQRLLPFIALLLLISAVPVLSNDKTRAVADKESAKKSPAVSSAVTAGPKTPVMVPGTPGTATSVSAPLYKLDWYSVNAGGATNATSTAFKMGLSVGQSVAGEASSASNKLGIGFWNGTSLCNCPSQGDVNGDTQLDVFDVIGLVNIAFSGYPDTRDSGCPTTRSDVNFDTFVDVFDILYLVNAAFSGGPLPVNPCAP